MRLFGSNVPFAEPGWYRGIASPYYNDSHVALRAKVRDFVDKELLPNVDEWEEACCQQGREVDFKAITRKAAAAGILAPMYPESMGGTPLPGGVKFDAFHDLIWIDELSRTGASGLIACITMFTMALPPIVLYGSQSVKDKVIKPVLKGEKCVALCITEAGAGSDMAGLQATAERITENGKDFYVINGQKKASIFSFH
jgi:alkylation response protein AidB-like acyl-CoA dehydrogenase